jgi:diacylglycerol kinase
MSESFTPPRKTWVSKFVTAFHGLWLGMHGHNSFIVHVPAAILVMAAALYLRIPRMEACALLLSVTIVLASELFNSALETLAKAVTRTEDPFIAKSLDIASGAVLMAAIGSAMVGIVIFWPHVKALVS